MPTQKEIAGGLRTERQKLITYLEGLPEAAWDKATLCEGWKVRDVVSHLIGNAADIAAQNLEGAGSEEYNQRQVDERAGKSPAELLAEWAEAGPALEQGIEQMDDEFWKTPYLELGTVGEAVERLLEDIWVHAQDIRIPLGDGPVNGPGIAGVFNVWKFELPRRLPRLAPGVAGVEIRSGDLSRTVRVGEGSPVAIEGDPITLALIATGRYELDRANVEPAPPSGFADAVNIYGP
jgi:uncharacterized protein (TIGR03083 family)